MADIDKITGPEKEGVPVPESAPTPKPEQGPVLETKEITPEEKMLARQMRKEIEAMETDPGLKDQAEKKAEEIKVLDEQTKIASILEIARRDPTEKGLVLAIKTAQKTNEPYILDMVHDALVQEGRYKNREK